MPKKNNTVLMTKATISLYTNIGVRLFDGIYKDEFYAISVYRYANKIKEAWVDAKDGSLLANYFLLQTENKIAMCKRYLYTQIISLKQKNTEQLQYKLLTQLQTRSIVSMTPYPYMVANLVVMADQYISMSFCLRHQGIITHHQANGIKSQAIKNVRKILEYSGTYISQMHGDTTSRDRLAERLGKIPYAVVQGNVRPQMGPSIEV